jgi:hypothetical protein
MKLTEDQLCEIFAEGVKDVPEFSKWLLRKTKFAPFAACCRLLHQEQMEIRPRKQWWRHWWCHVPELTKARETDIFMVFETIPGTDRFALHIENKRDNYRFNEGQAAAYGPRAKHMLGKIDFLSHTDFSTVLLAPRSFKARFEVDCALFDVFIAYEEVAHFLPVFPTTSHGRRS